MKMAYGEEKRRDLLLIEDNSGDILLTKEAFEEINFKENLHVASDGEDALDFLFKNGPYQDAPTPDLIFLDLNLPKKDGREVLQILKSEDRLKSIPVVILTTSSNDRDIKTCYDLHANCYVVKPVDFEEFLEIIRFLVDFWLKMVKLPPK